MKFNQKYPEQADAVKVFPEKMIGPHAPLQVTDTLQQSWRSYPCVGCGTPTSWRDLSDGIPTPVCSEECAGGREIS